MNQVIPTDPSTLTIKTCLAHLDQEEAFLVDTRTVLREIREALATRDSQGLAKLLQRQDSLGQAAQELFACRRKLRQSIARLLNLRLEEVTLYALGKHVSGQFHDEIEVRRQHLSSLVGEVQTLQQTNAALIHQSVHLLNMILAGIDGKGANEPRYGSSGQAEYEKRDPTFQTRC